jgi:hypothetical protein
LSVKIESIVFFYLTSLYLKQIDFRRPEAVMFSKSQSLAMILIRFFS